MKKLSVFIVCSLLLLAACKKRDIKSSPLLLESNEFKCMFDGLAYDLKADGPSYSPVYPNEIGGYVSADSGHFALNIVWPAGDTVQESDVLALAGKTLGVSDGTALYADLSFSRERPNEGAWFSGHKTSPSFNVLITTVNYVMTDTDYVGDRTSLYLISGFCNASLYHYPDFKDISGQFKMTVVKNNF